MFFIAYMALLAVAIGLALSAKSKADQLEKRVRALEKIAVAAKKQALEITQEPSAGA